MSCEPQYPTPLVCEHGSLRDKCEICERDEEISELKNATEKLERENQELKNSILEIDRRLVRVHELLQGRIDDL